jgi:radical SAM enzyme (TIGR01210 family)
MPEESRREILKMIGRHPDIKMLVLETRPEFVSQETIKEIKRLVPDKHVEIAIGLEIKDDFLRRVCVNKGFSLQQYTRAAEIITRQLHLRTYILLKPPFLTEKEAVTHAIETILYAFAVGSETVSLEACTIQDYTLVQYLAHQGLYKTPWLWSILEVVKSSFKRKFNRGKLVIGLFQFFPSPQEVPYNCDKCSSRVMEAIRCYNRTLDLSAFNQLNCLCKKEWEDEIKRKYPSFEKRLEHIIGQLNNDLENSTRGHGTGLKQCQGET